jgi:hypothetical protein
MKKTILISILIIVVAALSVMPVSAKPSVIKGEVTAINGNILTILTSKNQTINITTPAEFDLSTLAIGDNVIVKGQVQADGSVVADWVRRIGKGTSDDENTPEGSKATNSAYCSGNKKQHPHPMANSLAEKYGVTSEWIMEYYCDGYSMGAIMLALQTQKINGADANTVLAQRSSGQGWGAIWQGLKMIGSEKDIQTPPGLLKKGNQGNH